MHEQWPLSGMSRHMNTHFTDGAVGAPGGGGVTWRSLLVSQADLCAQGWGQRDNRKGEQRRRPKVWLDRSKAQDGLRAWRARRLWVGGGDSDPRQEARVRRSEAVGLSGERNV